MDPLWHPAAPRGEARVRRRTQCEPRHHHHDEPTTTTTVRRPSEHRRPARAGADARRGDGRVAQRRAGPHPAVLHQGHGLRRPAHPDPAGRPRRGRVLPGPLEPRQGGPLHPRRQLHRLLLVEGLRQGRDHHLGDPADRLPVGRAGQPGVRAPRLPARRRLLLVHLLADPGPLPLRPRRAAADVPRGQVPARRRPGQGLGAHRRQPAARQGLQVRPRQGRPGPRQLGRGHRDGRRRLRPHDPEVGPRPGGGLLADPGDVDGLPRVRRPLHLARRRLDAVVLRLVRRPAGRLAPGLRRPDRRPRVRRLVGRRLPGHVGLQRARHPHPRRALDDRGPLPRPEGRRGRAGLRRQREVRRRVAGDRARHRRGAGHGHGPRDPQGVLRRPGDAVLPRLHQDATPTCPTWWRSTRSPPARTGR